MLRHHLRKPSRNLQLTFSKSVVTWGGGDFFTKKEALRQLMDRETYEEFMKYPSQRGITQHPLLHNQGEVLSFSPPIGLSNPSLRNGTLCFFCALAPPWYSCAVQEAWRLLSFFRVFFPNNLSVICGRSCPAAPTLLFFHEPTRMEARYRWSSP